MTLAPPPKDFTEKYRTPPCHELDQRLLIKELLARGCRSVITPEELDWYYSLSSAEHNNIVPGRRMPDGLPPSGGCGDTP